MQRLGNLAIILTAACIFPFWAAWWLVKNAAFWLYDIWCILGEIICDPAVPTVADKLEADYLTTKWCMNDAAGKSYRNMVT